MKKNIFRFAALLMAGALLVLACGKNNTDPTPKPDDNNGEQKPDDKPDQPEETKGVEITLDGSFSDWDALTEEVAKNNEYVDIYKGGADDPIQVLKIAADADNVFFYIEFPADHLPQNATCGTWGNSYEENTLDPEYVGEYGPDDDEFREVMHLFIDPDAKGNTGFFTFADAEGDPAIPGLGCEMCAQFFMYFNPGTSLVSVAFEQTLIGPTKVGNVGDNDQVDENGYTGDFDYNGTICQDDWPDSGSEAAFPLWGWQNFDNSGTGDNDCPRPENWKPAKAQGGIAKVEFCVEKDDIYNLKDSDTEFACGIIFDFDEYYQATGILTISYVK